MGMTRIFDKIGSDFPVTILESGPCHITQVKTIEKDGYCSIQLAFLNKMDRHIKKAEKGHFEKANVTTKKYIKEFRADDISNIAIGQEIDVDIFEAGKADAALAASIFHYSEHAVADLKNHLQGHNIPVRLMTN